MMNIKKNNRIVKDSLQISNISTCNQVGKIAIFDKSGIFLIPFIAMADFLGMQHIT